MSRYNIIQKKPDSSELKASNNCTTDCHKVGKNIMKSSIYCKTRYLNSVILFSYIIYFTFRKNFFSLNYRRKKAFLNQITKITRKIYTLDVRVKLKGRKRTNGLYCILMKYRGRYFHE